MKRSLLGRRSRRHQLRMADAWRAMRDIEDGMGLGLHVTDATFRAAWQTAVTRACDAVGLP